jgi:hypothetical protein
MERCLVDILRERLLSKKDQPKAISSANKKNQKKKNKKKQKKLEGIAVVVE